MTLNKNNEQISSGLINRLRGSPVYNILIKKIGFVSVIRGDFSYYLKLPIKKLLSLQAISKFYLNKKKRQKKVKKIIDFKLCKLNYKRIINNFLFWFLICVSKEYVYRFKIVSFF
jgi:hypothetical protein